MTTPNEPGRVDAWSDIVVKWWEIANGERAPGWAKADRAALRRTHDVQEVLLTPAFQRLYAELREQRPDDARGQGHRDAERLAAGAALASQVIVRSGQSLPRAMSHDPERTGRPPVSELRFMRLLESPDLDSLFRGLRRTLPLIDGTVDLRSLVNDVYLWNDHTRKQWAYDYRWPAKSGVR